MYTKLKTYKENILVPRNLEGRHEKLKQERIKFLNQETIEGDFKLEKWILDIPEHLIKVKTINGYFDCSELDLIEFPKWFEKLTINGSFSCSFNKLTTLKGCPHTINGYFNCMENKLISLESCPQIINGNFYCSFNKLKTLKYSPHTIKGSFNCRNNELITLEGCPQVINGNFDCSNNQLISLKYGPKYVEYNYYCIKNKIKLQKPEDCEIKYYFYN